MFVEHTGLTSPLILATNDLSKHTKNELLKSPLDLFFYIVIKLLMKLSVPGKDSKSIARFRLFVLIFFSCLYK